MADGLATPQEVVEFWCETLSPADWWKSTPDLDARIRDRFAATHLALSRGVSDAWRATACAAVSLVAMWPPACHSAQHVPRLADGLCYGLDRAS